MLIGPCFMELILAARSEFTPMIFIGASRRFVAGRALCVPMLFIGTTYVPIRLRWTVSSARRGECLAGD